MKTRVLDTLARGRRLLPAALAFACLLLFAACGAEVTSYMEVDESFNGSRSIWLHILQEDMEEYVESGLSGLSDTAGNYLPADMSYEAYTIDEDGQTTSVMVFTIEFNGIDDYTAKVERILAANPDNTLEADVQYEYESTDFKSGLSWYENFTAADLMGWYIYGLDQDGRIDYDDKGDWYSLEGNTVVFAGETHELWGNSISLSEMESNTFNDIRTETYVYPDGTFTRDIAFEVSSDAVERLEAKGNALVPYFEALAPAGATVTETGQDWYITYNVAFHSDSEAELVAATDAILQTSNSFSATLSSQGGVASLTISEATDGSTYLDLGYNSVYSRVYMAYDTNVVGVTSDYGYYVNIDEATRYYYVDYSLYDAEPNEIVLNWTMRFDTAEVVLQPDSKNVAMELVLGVDDTAGEKAIAMMGEGLEYAVGQAMVSDFMPTLEQTQADGMHLYTIRFDGVELEYLPRSYDSFMRAYLDGYPDTTYLSLEYLEMLNSKWYNTNYELTGMVSVADITADNEFTFTIQSSFPYSLLDMGEKVNEVTTSEYGYVYFTQYGSSLNLVAILIAVVVGIAAAVAIVIFAVKQSKKPRPAPAPVAAAPVEAIDFAEPVAPAPAAPVAKAPPVQPAAPQAPVAPVQAAPAPTPMAPQAQPATPVQQPVQQPVPVAPAQPQQPAPAPQPAPPPVDEDDFL